ncbi:hypothetical protein [Paenibacillus tarimensis]|uniref:hypothetical protein n=1 Tax=Paenibacillus tarimensis TaxID=416012 RepID=UPI001F318124|nr:hypothetical protein [Paenibacillus tarimensis]MCF2942879.1 hypothetical protein [Paenibacillus tarimensis]
MSRISIQPGTVLDSTAALNRVSLTMSNAAYVISAVKSGVDGQIQARRGIGGRLSQASRAASNLNTMLNELSDFVKQSVNRYVKTDQSISRKAQYVGLLTGSSVSDVSIHAYSLLLGDRRPYIAARNALLLYAANALNSGKRLKLAKDLGLKFVRNADGSISVRMTKANITSNQDYIRYRNMMSEALGGTAKWNREFLTRLAKEGVPIYDPERGYYRSNANKLSNTRFGDLNRYVESVQDSRGQVMRSATRAAFIDNLKVWESFTGWKDASAMTRVGKGIGAAGVGLTVFDNVVDNFYVQQTGEWRAEPGKVKEFVVDTAVDVGTAAGSAAAGAVVGSFFLPPAGTVVGAAAGAGINFVLNTKMIGDPPQSVVDVTKNAANAAVDKIGDAADSVKKKLDKIFW